jgi:dihydroorotate dehydrogenase electron transfer subunit
MPVGIRVLAATDDGSAGQTGMVTSLISGQAEHTNQVFACGPMAMYRDMSVNRNRLGLEGKPVQVSIEATMACGHGVCYGCTVATKQGLRQVCKDGPVFELGDLSLTDLS